jgi:hypothetical protein
VTRAELIPSACPRKFHPGGIGVAFSPQTNRRQVGALGRLTSDVAIVYPVHGSVAMAITVSNIPEVNDGVENPGNLLISKLSSILVEELAP